MKVREIFESECDCEPPSEENNFKKARRIAVRAKGKAKKANPGESETDVQAHLGSHVSSFLNR